MEDQKNLNMVEVLELCEQNRIPARAVGNWVWVKFKGKPNSAIRQLLKEIGFRWSKRRGQWANNCGVQSGPAKGYAPWDKYETKSANDILSKHRSTQ